MTQRLGSALPAIVVLAVAMTAALIDQANYQQDLTFIALTVIAALVAVAVAMTRRPSGGQSPIGPAGVLLLMLIAWSALAISWSRVPYLTGVDLAAMGSVAFAYAAWRIVMAPEQGRYRAVMGWAITAAGLAMAVTMIAQFFTGHRPAAFFANPNSAATLVNALWPVVAVAWLAPRGTLLGAQRWHNTLPAYLFLMIFAVGIDGSRAAFLAAVVVLATVIGAAAYGLSARRRSLLVVAGVFVTALLAAWLVNALGLGSGRALGERIGSLASPDQAGAVRFLQWGAAWELIRDSPWLGIGPDVFWQAYAAIRPAGDGSAGLYVHNDYLQYWVERGLPGLLLVIGIVAACAYAFVRSLMARRAGALDTPSMAMVIAAFAGIAGLGVHGLFSYQLQMPSVLIPAFILIAELERLAPVRPAMTLPLPNWRRPLSLTAGAGVFAIIALSVGLPGAAQYRMEQGVSAMNRGEFESAEAAFQTAQRRWGWADTPWLHHAALYQRLLAIVPDEESDTRAQLASEALRLLDIAGERNPLRGRTEGIRGQLLRMYPELTNGDASLSFRQALMLNPRLVSARLHYAALLREQGESQAALELLEQGVALEYGRETRAIPLYQVTAAARSSAGDRAGAERLEARVERIRDRLRRRLDNTD